MARSPDPADFSDQAAPPTPDLVAPAPMMDSQALLRGGRELLIVHGDQLYRLRHTRNDKLILTK